jgi:hypothetical protein
MAAVLVLMVEQQRFIIRAADDMPPALRRPFLNAVVDVLMGRQPTNADVARACGAVRGTMILGPGSPAIDPDDGASR